MSVSRPPASARALDELDVALALEGGERTAYVRRLAADDPEVARELDELLAAAAAAGPLDASALALAGDLLEAGSPTEETSLPTSVGPYRIVRELGRGGMGTVFLGERDDGQFRQRVAVKVIQHGTRGGHGIRRFERERSILAELAHPHVARLTDGGVTTEGLPWFAMELVEGEPITAHVEHGGLSVDGCLRLAIDVCDAVDYAHRQGVVHRDIKPSNILVDGNGQVKLLDFGIARLLEADGDATVTRTQALTPEYAAPEQLAGAPATPASDVFQIGLVVHELLVGPQAAAPRRGSSATGAPLLTRASPRRQLRAALAARPDAAPAAPLRRRLAAISRDLDAVVEKAIAIDPGERYASAAELGEDLRRAIAGRAVSARPATAAGRALKLARRHPAATAGAAAVLVALAIAAGALRDASQARRGTAMPQHFRLVSTFPGSHRAPSISPDGARMAYVEFGLSAVPEVWVKDLASGPPRQLTFGTPAAGRPRWSPQGNTILFERTASSSASSIWSVPAGGGEPRELLSSAKTPNWSADGKRIVFERENRVWLANADGSGAHEVAGVPTDPFMSFVDLSPALSPDGRWIAFFLCSHGPNGDLWVVRSTGGGARRLTHDARLGGEPVWTPDGRAIVYSSARSGSTTLWRISPDGGEPVAWTTGSGEDLDPEIDASGRHLLFTNAQDAFALAATDPASGRTRVLVEQRGDLVAPEVSPDGKTVAYFGQEDAGYHVYTVGIDGSGLRRLTGGRELSTFPRWSGDGRSLYYYVTDPDNGYFRMPAAGGARSLVRADLPLTSWSTVDPSERLLASNRGDPWNPDATRLIDLAGGGERTLSTPLLWPRFTPDGANVVGFDFGRHLVACPVDGAPCRKLAEHAHTPAFAGADSSRVYFLRGPRRLDDPSVGEVQVFTVNLDGTGERHLIDLGPILVHDKALAVTSGGELLWTKLQRSRHQIWMADLP